MVMDRDVMARQSAILLNSAASDSRLMEALQEIDNLKRTLETEKKLHREKVLITFYLNNFEPCHVMC
jgi:hypothetical protein